MAQADHLDIRDIHRRQCRAGGDIGLGHDTGANAPLADQLCKHGSGGGIERATPGDAQDRRRCGPCRLYRRRIRRILIVAIGQVAQQFGDTGADAGHLGFGQHTALDIDGRKLQAGDRDLVIIGRQRLVLHPLLGGVVHLVEIASQHALVEALHRGQRRLVAEQHIEKLQPPDMAPEHDQAQGERHRQNQADRSP